MAVKNRLAVQSANTKVVEYECGGQLVKLSPNIIRNYLVTVRAKDEGAQILEWSDYRSTEPPKEEEEKTMKTKIDDKPLSFQETMKIKKRICETMSYKCENCCITSDADSCNDFFMNYADEMERHKEAL